MSVVSRWLSGYCYMLVSCNLIIQEVVSAYLVIVPVLFRGYNTFYRKFLPYLKKRGLIDREQEDAMTFWIVVSMTLNANNQQHRTPQVCRTLKTTLKIKKVLSKNYKLNT